MTKLIAKIIEFFCGKVRIFAEKEYSNRLVAFLTENKVECSISPSADNKGICVDISPRLLKNIASSLDKSGIIVYIINVYGFARICSKYRMRLGLLLGMLMFAATLWTSTLFVWRVEPNGGSLISNDTLRAELSEMGVHPGALISGINKTEIANEFLSKHPELSWAALNFNGTTVSLTVKETLTPPETTEKDAPLLVAKHSGVITYIGVYEGTAAVRIGSVVKKGDVLISGYVSGSGLQMTDTPLLRPGNARGEVKAEVSGSITTRSDFEEAVETELSGEIIGRRISVFGRDMTFGETDGASSEHKNVTVFGFIELPITIQLYRESSYHTETVNRTPDEAVADAKQKAYRELSEEFPDCEVLKISFETSQDEDGITVIMRYTCVTDIAEKKYLSTVN